MIYKYVESGVDLGCHCTESFVEGSAVRPRVARRQGGSVTEPAILVMANIRTGIGKIFWEQHNMNFWFLISTKFSSLRIARISREMVEIKSK